MAVVVYPSNTKTDIDKLFACYSLCEQMRLEHNRQAEDFRNRLTLEPIPEDIEEQKEKFAKGFVRPWCPEGFMLADNPENNSLRAKFRTYAHESKARQKQLLAEQNRLKENIRWANYTPKQWKAVSKLGLEEQATICQNLFGDKAVEKVKTTKATSPVLDGLKALDLDAMPESLGSDPTEDFTSANWNNGTPQSDPNSRLTVTANRIAFAGLLRNEDVYHYRDAGIDHFDGDFEHLFKVLADTGVTAGTVWLCTLANTIDDFKGILDANGSLQCCGVMISVNGCSYYLYELDSGSGYVDDVISQPLDIVHYIEFERNEAVGTYGTIYSYICTTDYWDDGGTQVDTLTVALHTSKKDFRYVYGVQSHNSGQTYSGTGYIELLDLQEGVAAVTRSHGYIMG